MISIIYQYHKHDGDFQEIYHSVESVKRNFKASKFQLVFIGDLPDKMDCDLFIPHPMGNVRRTPWYDVSLKMEMIIADPRITTRFMMMHDDMYIMRPIEKTNVINHFYYMPWPNRDRLYHSIMYDTKDTLEKVGFPSFNCETHLPRIYNKNKMKVLFQKFKPKENALVYSTLYFNYHHMHNKKTMLKKGDRIKAGFYGRNDSTSHPNYLYNRDLDDAISKCLFLNHNDAGLTRELKAYIQQKFPIFDHN